MRVSVNVASDVNLTARVRQVCSMFDCPPEQKSARSWTGDIPIEDRDWRVGLIVGPSGAGKSTLAREMFGEPWSATWGSSAVIDEVAPELSVSDISSAFSSVGFNTIPAWLRPYHVLSNGERFRVDMARALLEGGSLVMVDEFTSVVDRQVAQIGAHAVQKYVRRRAAGQQFVAVTCHYDVADWLQPDWILEPATMSFTWRSVQPRPRIDVVVKRCAWDTWSLFAPYHYMSAQLHRGARCYAAYVGDRPVCFLAVLPLPISRGRNVGEAIVRVSRHVTLPDWQGLGIAFAMCEAVAAAYAARGQRVRHYPAHPSFVRQFQRRSTQWLQIKQLGTYRERDTRVSQARPCAIFEYIGPVLDSREADRLLAH